MCDMSSIMQSPRPASSSPASPARLKSLRPISSPSQRKGGEARVGLLAVDLALGGGDDDKHGHATEVRTSVKIAHHKVECSASFINSSSVTIIRSSSESLPRGARRASTATAQGTAGTTSIPSHPLSESKGWERLDKLTADTESSALLSSATTVQASIRPQVLLSVPSSVKCHRRTDRRHSHLCPRRSQFGSLSHERGLYSPHHSQFEVLTLRTSWPNGESEESTSNEVHRLTPSEGIEERVSRLTLPNPSVLVEPIQPRRDNGRGAPSNLVGPPAIVTMKTSKRSEVRSGSMRMGATAKTVLDPSIRPLPPHLLKQYPGLIHRSHSLPTAAIMFEVPRVTISDFSTSTPYSACLDSYAMESHSCPLSPTPSRFAVTLEDVAPFKYHRKRTMSHGSNFSNSSYGSMKLNDDAWSCTNSSCGTSCETADDQSEDGPSCVPIRAEPYPEEQCTVPSLVDKPAKKKPSGWRKLRSMVQWTPFIQTYKHKRYQWVQLAGHSGNFKAGKSQGTVLKKLCAQEEVCYRKLDNDAMVQFVPKYQGVLTLDDDEKFIQLQDCLSSFTNPSIMDCKIGVRTYLEEELAKAKEKPKLRRDMYDKMIAVDSSAPTEEEHKLKGVTKPRYMVWRETISSTATLGFRIEGVKMSDGSSSKDFKTTKTKDQVFEAFQKFLSFSPDKAVQYLERLRVIRSSLEGSKFFHEHELIGSSLLFVHDSKKASIWLIDFGKTVPLPSGVVIDHKSPWEVGNHEDGYLIGIDNLVNIMAQVVSLDRSKPEDTSVSSRHSSSSSTRPKSVTKPPVSSSS